jgi:hypothetical protein
MFLSASRDPLCLIQTPDVSALLFSDMCFESFLKSGTFMDVF